jgi:acyl CoA:acetate/3-ketoacid CoA transferase beta subunit
MPTGKGMAQFSVAPVPESCVYLWHAHKRAVIVLQKLRGCGSASDIAAAEQRVILTLNNWHRACEHETDRRMALMVRLREKFGPKEPPLTDA